MKTIKSRTILLVIALTLVLSLSVGLSLAYFSDYANAEGGAKLSLGATTEIDEEVDPDTGAKSVWVNNTGDTNVVVRVAIVGPTQMEVTAAENWVKNGDYYYYKKVLKPGESTKVDTLVAQVTLPAGTDLGDEYQIVVVHESAQPTYDGENNVEKPEGWDYIPAIKAE